MRAEPWLRLGVLAALAAGPTLAFAAPEKLPPGQKSPAGASDRLFAEGQAALDAKDYPTACKKFQQSRELEPALGTLLNLAICFEEWGRIGSALTIYEEARVAAERAGQSGFAEAALERIDALGPRRSRVVVYTKPAGVDGLSIRIRGGGHAEKSLSPGTKVDVDPVNQNTGLYALTVEISAPGYKAYETTISPTEGKTHDVEHALVPVTGASPGVGGNVSRDSTPGTANPSGGWTGRRKLGLGLAAGGAATLGTSLALNLYWRGNDEPGDDTPEKKRMRYVGTPLFVAGLGLAAVGTYLFITGGRAPAREAARTVLVPTASSGGAGVALVGDF